MKHRHAVLRAEGLWKTYIRRRDGKKEPFHCLQGTDFALREGEISALMGRSGSGKSTLARCLAFLDLPDRGVISFRGHAVDPSLPNLLRSMRRKTQLVFQDPARSVNPYFSVRDALEEPLLAGGLSRFEMEERCVELLDQVRLPASILSEKARRLSGGQAQRLALARALAVEPEVLILDESFSGLDLSLQAHWVNLVLELVSRRALSCLLITHDEDLARQVAGCRFRMVDGKVLAEDDL